MEADMHDRQTSTSSVAIDRIGHRRAQTCYGCPWPRVTRLWLVRKMCEKSTVKASSDTRVSRISCAEVNLRYSPDSSEGGSNEKPFADHDMVHRHFGNRTFHHSDSRLRR